MSDNQRRAFCRILFLAMCVLPTSAIGYWICHPQTAGGWERAIQAQLGVTTKIDFVETPGPYVTILRNLKFLDLDGHTMFKTVTTKIEYGSKFNQITFPEKVSGLTNEGLAFLVDSIEQNVIQRRSAEKHWIVVFEKNATVGRALGPKMLGTVSGALDTSITPVELGASMTVSELTIEIGPTLPKADGAYAKASFKIFDPVHNLATGDLITCDISKTDQYGHVMLLNTNQSALPCWLITHPALDLPSTIGGNATFSGELRLEPTPTTVNMELAGIFANVNLFPSVTDASQNTASIQMKKCRYERGELLDWDAQLFVNSESSPKRIDKKNLFMSSRKLDYSGSTCQNLVGPAFRKTRYELSLGLLLKRLNFAAASTYHRLHNSSSISWG